MTGLVNTAPSPSNLGAMLGSAGAAPITRTTGPMEQGAVPFLDLLWLFGGDVPLEVPLATDDFSLQEDQLPEETAQASLVAPALIAAAPPQIADALIRSMLQAGTVQPRLLRTDVLPPAVLSTISAADTSPVEQLGPSAAESARPPMTDEAEEWDLPLEWIGPEELADGERATNLDTSSIVMPGSIPILDRDSAVAPCVPAPALNATQTLPSAPATTSQLPQSAPPPVSNMDRDSAGVAPSVPVPALTAAQASTSALDTTSQLSQFAPPDSKAVLLYEAAVPSSSTSTQIAVPQGMRATPHAPQRGTEPPAPLAFALRLTTTDRGSSEGLVHPGAPSTTNTSALRLAPLAATQQIALESNQATEAKARPAVMMASLSSPQSSTIESLSGDFPGEDPGDTAEQEESKAESSAPPKTERESGPKSASLRSESTPVASLIPAAAPTLTAQAAAPRPVLLERPGSAGIAASETASPHQMEAAPSPEIRPGTAREISVRISAPDAAPVDLHIAQRGGEVRVAVRASDAGLQVSLRQDLGTLVDRLEQSGFQAETLLPQEPSSVGRMESTQSFDLTSSFRAHAVQANEATPGDSSQDKDDSGHQRDQTDSGARQQQQQRRQNSSQHFNWMKAMEDEV